MSTRSSKFSTSTSESTSFESKKEIGRVFITNKSKKKVLKNVKYKNEGKWNKEEIVRIYTCYAVKKKFDIFDKSIVPSRSRHQIYLKQKITKNLDAVVNKFWMEEEESYDYQSPNPVFNEFLVRKMGKFLDSCDINF